MSRRLTSKRPRRPNPGRGEFAPWRVLQAVPNLRYSDEETDSEGVQVEDDEDGGEEGAESQQDEEDSDEEQDTSQSIRGALTEILTGEIEFAGAFSFNKTYPAAPNPVLKIDGLGTIGLPLSVRDAAGIKSCSEQAPFGKAEQTVVDKSVRDTWEIDASKVHFRNDAWQPFMDQTVRDVCEVLGVNYEASQPRCELYRLLLYETGSHFLPHVDTEKVDGMFATVVVILPSEFTGGAVHVSHGDIRMSYDSSPGSLMNTSVLAWYTDVEHEVKAITSGFRLALSFNLIHTTDALRPTLSECTLPPRLQHTLQLWQQAQGTDDAPQKIISLLSHKYSRAALRGSALKGVDAHLVAVLDNVGKQYGIRLGLANLTCTESGTADDYGGGGRGWGRRGWGCDDSDCDSDHGGRHYNVEMEEVEKTDVKIEHFVDLNGTLIGRSIDCDFETEVIPDGLVEQITSGRHDHQEYEGYQGNYGGTVERFYRRTVLIMWPSWAHFDVVHGSEGFSYACKAIRQSTSQKPTAEETELTEIILARATASQCVEVVQSVCLAAIRWKDVSLWSRAVKVCEADRSIGTLNEDHVYQAISAFGFAKVKNCLEHALEQEPSSVRALRFVENLAAWVGGQRSKQVKNTSKIWIPTQRKRLWDALKPVGKDEHKELTVLALKYKGVEFFETIVLPRIQLSTDSDVLLEHAVYLSTGSEAAMPVEERVRMARDLLAAAIAKVDWYASTPIADPRYAYSKPPEEPGQLQRAKLYVKAAVELGREDIFPTVVDKLVDLSGQMADVVTRRIKGVLFPVISYVEEISRALPDGAPPPALHRLSTSANWFYVQAALADPQRILAADVPSLVQAMIISEGPEGIITRVIPKLEGLKLDNGILRAFIQELRAQRAAIDPTKKNLTPLLWRLLKRYINALNFTTPVLPAYHHARAYTYNKPAIDALEFCLKLGYSNACKLVTARMLKPSQLDAKYIKEQLAPLVPDMCALLVKYQYPLTAEPFASAFRTIMLCWVEKVLGPPPPNAAAPHMGYLQVWARACNCSMCSHVRTFLTAHPAEKRMLDRIGAPTRQHLEGFLSAYAGGLATFETIRTTPQGLTIIKTRALVEPSKWAHVQGEGKQLLASISADDTELRAIFGADYERIVAGLEGRAARVVSSRAGAAPAASSSSTAAAAPRPSASSSRSTGKPQYHRVPAAVPARMSVQQVTTTQGSTAVGASGSKRPASDEVARASTKRRKMMAYGDWGAIDFT